MYCTYFRAFRSGFCTGHGMRLGCGFLWMNRPYSSQQPPMPEPANPGLAPRVWEVGALCRAVADALQARFNPVAVRGEITGFSRAASGHCYFTLKDGQGQLRCAMFRRAAASLGFVPRDGELVELRGQLAVYEARGDLQLIVEELRRAGQGALFEEFLRLKARLDAEGLFDAARKRALPAMPRAIGVVTSLGAAALHDVASALRRRLPHLPVLLVPALVQGAEAPASLCAALSKLYRLAQGGKGLEAENMGIPPIDVILLVRGGGSIEDLWAFNDEQLARTIAQSPVPLVSGVGHETDFTIADFCADLRAPTPTAAAELVAQPRDAWLAQLAQWAERLRGGAERQIDQRQQRLDMAAQRLGRPSGLVQQRQLALARLGARLRHGAQLQLARRGQAQAQRAPLLAAALTQGLARQAERLERAALRLTLLDPQQVLARGWSLLTDGAGQLVTRAGQVRTGDRLHARLAEGEIDLIAAAPPRLL